MGRIIEVPLVATVAQVMVGFSERASRDPKESSKFARLESSEALGDVSRRGSR